MRTVIPAVAAACFLGVVTHEARTDDFGATAVEAHTQDGPVDPNSLGRSLQVPPSVDDPSVVGADDVLDEEPSPDPTPTPAR